MKATEQTYRIRKVQKSGRAVLEVGRGGTIISNSNMFGNGIHESCKDEEKNKEEEVETAKPSRTRDKPEGESRRERGRDVPEAV